MTLTTERLQVSEITQSDIQHIHTMNSFKEVAEFNTIGIPKNLADTQNLLKSVLDELLIC